MNWDERLIQLVCDADFCKRFEYLVQSRKLTVEDLIERYENLLTED